ncbi:MAG: SEC-C domain-containing protein [Tannerellaceae bacterium]|nr:SEC-C domain-containing protein [Tannerellaceae bacterium]
MSNKTGRNDPCPCGSGKKYKFCCGSNTSEGKIISFPGVNGNSPFSGQAANEPMIIGPDLETFDEDAARYQQYIESGQAEQDGNPSFMEFMNKPNAATELTKKIQDAIGDRVFSSEEEMQEFLDEFQGTYNNSGKEDFKGLSPAQMRQILESEDLRELDSIVSIAEKPFGKLASTVPLVKLISYLLDRYRDNKNALDITPRGNYKRILTQQVAKIFLEEGYEERYINREQDVRLLWFAHQFLLDSELIKDEGTKSRLTPVGVHLATDFNAEQLWINLFEYYRLCIDWQEQGLYSFPTIPAFDTIQDSAMFSLYLLSKYKGKWITEDTLYDDFATAFPEFQKMSRVSDIDIPRIRYGTWFLYLFCKDLGLIEYEHTERRKNRETSPKFRSTELFKKIFKWNV